MFSAVGADKGYVCIFDFGECDKARLRSLARDDQYACPICGWLLNVNLGEEKAWHFSHRPGAPSGCPLKHTDREKAKAVYCFYSWIKKYKSGVVENLRVEYAPPGLQKQLAIDIYFERDNRVFLYNVCRSSLSNKSVERLTALYSSYCLNDIHYGGFLDPVRKLRSFQTDGVGSLMSYSDIVNCSHYDNYGQRYVVGMDADTSCFYIVHRSTRAGLEAESGNLVETIPFEVASIRPSTGQIVAGRDGST